MIGIVVLFPKTDNARMIKGLLVKSGFTVVALCTTGAQAMSAVDDLSEGIVVCGYKYPDMMYNELRAELPECIDMMLVAGAASLQDVTEKGIVCVEMPIKAGILVETLSSMVEDAERRRRERKQKPRVRTGEEKETIDGAKSLLMRKNGMSEEEAHRYLQKISMDTGTGLVEAAEMVMLISGR